jgi:hypothetical protein
MIAASIGGDAAPVHAFLLGNLSRWGAQAEVAKV